MTADRVLTINDYYDGPRLGIAEFGGVPHIYEAEFDHSSDEYGDTYFLSPIGEELLTLVLEDWDIWCRWDFAYESGEVDVSTHPALPSERARHECLVQLIGGRLKTDATKRIYCTGTFFTPPENRGSWNGTLVRWTPK
jgi:hypothetical protein